MAKTICFGKIRLCTTYRSCIFGVLDDSFHHKNFIGTYYTLYTIVYNYFYAQNIFKILNFTCYDKKVISQLGDQLWLPGCLFLGQKTGPDRTLKH
jgi:hypothetical protein